ncbi:MAG: hypothetical protein V4544_00115 [Pseudomonadota bacterium]
MFVIHGHKKEVVSSEYFSGQCQICKSNRLFLCDLKYTGSVFLLPIINREFKKIICDSCHTEYKIRVVDERISLRPLNKVAKLIRILETTKSVVYSFYSFIALFFALFFAFIYCEKEIDKINTESYKQSPQVYDTYIIKSVGNEKFPYKVMKITSIRTNEFFFDQLDCIFRDISSAEREVASTHHSNSYVYYTKKDLDSVEVSKIIRPNHKLVLSLKEKLYIYFSILKDLFKTKLKS